MTSREHRTLSWIERPVFWTIILALLFFLLGVGLGARLAMLGIQQQLTQLPLNKTNQIVAYTQASGEVVGTVTAINTEQLTVMSTDQMGYTFNLSSGTEIFAFIGESTPLLPGENRDKMTVGLADLQPNDMVVVRYTEVQQAVSIQKIR